MKIKRKIIDKKYLLIRKRIDKYIRAGEQGKALYLLELMGSYLFSINYKYTDEFCEKRIRCLAKSIQWDKNMQSDNSSVIFYDGFGADTRGLALIYIRALINKGFHIIYIVNAGSTNEIPSIAEVINRDNKSDIIFLTDVDLSIRLNHIKKVVETRGCNKFIFYSLPQDVVGIILAESLENQCKRYLINLTDHAFWLGIHAFDYYIEFRDYGASVSRFYRGIEAEKIVKLPFYPDINKDIPFAGFPFELKEEKKLVFSGGSLYKTFGDYNKYYHIIKTMLKKHPEVIFLYAGYGNRKELNNLAKEYENRVFYMDERKDLYEIMRHSHLYMSTYPIAGGLMTQYAVAAGKIPLTLVFDECSVGLLMYEDKLKNVLIRNYQVFMKELDKLLTDNIYLSEQEKLIENQLITGESFENNLYQLLRTGNTEFSISYNDKLNVKRFQDIYINSLNSAQFYSIFITKNQKWLMFKNFPIEFSIGVFHLLIYKIKKKYLILQNKRKRM